MEKIELNLDALGRITGKSKQEVVNLLKSDESESGFLQGEALNEKIEGLFGDKFRSISDQQRGRAKREVMSDFEKSLRSQFSIEDGTLKGLELVNHIISSATPKSAELTPDNIKSSPFFRDAMKTKNDELQQLKSQFDSYKTEQTQRAIRSQVDSKAKSILLAMNPVLSKSEAVKDNQVKMFLTSMAGNFKLGEDGIKVLDKDNNELLDGSYNPVTFDQFVRTKAQSFFDFHEVDPSKKSPQDKTQHSTTKSGDYSFPTFANMNEAMQYLGKLKQEDTKKAMAFAQNIANFVKK